VMYAGPPHLLRPLYRLSVQSPHPFDIPPLNLDAQTQPPPDVTAVRLYDMDPVSSGILDKHALYPVWYVPFSMIVFMRMTGYQVYLGSRALLGRRDGLNLISLEFGVRTGGPVMGSRTSNR